MRILLQAWHENTVPEWSLATLLALSTLLILIVARHVAELILKALEKRDRTAPLSKVPAALVASTRLWLLIPLAMYVGATAVQLPDKLDHGLDRLVVVMLLVQAAFWINALISLWLTGQIDKRRGTDGEAVTALALVSFIARTVVWTFILLVILNHLDFNVSALVTGLGVGGVAVALAVQNVLGDLLASLSIVFDKPFVVGDFIIVDNFMGSVEKVGVKTTRLRSLSGELIIFSNSDLLKSRMRNYKQMYERRVAYNLNVAYGARTEQLEALPGFLKQSIEANTPVRFDSVHFKEFGEWAIVFEVVYFVLSPDNGLAMDIQQKINLDTHRYFLSSGLDFAHPVRTLQAAPGAALAVQLAPDHNTAPANEPDASAIDKPARAQQRGDKTWTPNAIA
ncbi:MAG: Mechanosensitive ion channel protein MscS [Betaproteobacteria bacterium]|nr:Mechanosensitive ion channel protein MscS [Betaproteobacteria bacterium]